MVEAAALEAAARASYTGVAKTVLPQCYCPRDIPLDEGGCGRNVCVCVCARARVSVCVLMDHHTFL